MVRGLSTFFGSLFDRAPAEAEHAAPDLASKEANDRLRRQLRALGDDTRAVRPVRHFAIRAEPEGADRAALLSLLTGQGFAPHGDHSEGYLGVSAEAPVHAPEFDNLTAGLAQTLAVRGWRYDGWECDVVETAVQNEDQAR